MKFQNDKNNNSDNKRKEVKWNIKESIQKSV